MGDVSYADAMSHIYARGKDAAARLRPRIDLGKATPRTNHQLNSIFGVAMGDVSYADAMSHIYATQKKKEQTNKSRGSDVNIKRFPPNLSSVGYDSVDSGESPKRSPMNSKLKGFFEETSDANMEYEVKERTS